MTNSFLYCLAAASMTLSFFYEKTPAAPTPAAAHAPRPAYLAAAADDAAPGHPATPADSAIYARYEEKLGVDLDHTEDKDLLQTVLDWMGTPYHYGSSSKRGTDCSGFVTRVYQQVYGITLKRSSRSMFQEVKRVDKDALQTGDLVFFRRGPGQPIYHVGIYLNDSKFAHSATNGGVMVSSLKQAYYHRNFYAAGRVGTE